MNINFQKLSKYISLIAVVVILISILAIPSYAASSSSGMTLLPYDTSFSGSYMYNSQLPNNSTLFYKRQINGSTYYDNIGISNKDNTYACYYMNNGSVHMAFFRDSDETFNVYWGERENGSSRCNTAISSWIPDAQGNNTIGKQRATYIVYGSSTAILNSEWTTFNSLEEATNAFLSFTQGAEPHQLSLSIPAGNALVIDISNLSTVEVQALINTEVAHPSSWYTNQYYSFMSSYPSSIGNRPSNANTINWNGYGQTTLFNRYKSFYWNNTIASSAGFLCITNPYASLDEYDQSFNPTINITVSQARGYKYYQLTGGISSDGNIGQQSDGTTASGTYDDSTGQWSTTNDETGLPWSPQEGGGNLITTNSINDWLKMIATQISNFFQGAIGAVTTLVNAGSSFINTLISLYSWLPAPVYAVLSSALILVITIGVIKVFI